jgi:hypothetical protein
MKTSLAGPPLDPQTVKIRYDRHMNLEKRPMVGVILGGLVALGVGFLTRELVPATLFFVAGLGSTQPKVSFKLLSVGAVLLYAGLDLIPMAMAGRLGEENPLGILVACAIPFFAGRMAPYVSRVVVRPQK